MSVHVRFALTGVFGMEDGRRRGRGAARCMVSCWNGRSAIAGALAISGVRLRGMCAEVRARDWPMQASFFFWRRCSPSLLSLDATFRCCSSNERVSQ